MVEEKNNKGLYALLIILIVCIIGLVSYIVYKDIIKNNPKEKENITDTRKQEIEQNKNLQEYKGKDDETVAEYGIISYGEVNPLKNLNFDTKEFSEMVTITSDKIKYDNPDDNAKTDIPISNVIQAGVNCNCGGCFDIYYLKSDGNLYSIKLDYGKVPKNYKSELISSNVSRMAIFEHGTIDSTTCGGAILALKDKDGKVTVWDKDVSSFERYWLEESGHEHDLFVVSNKAKVKNYLKDENGKNIIAKKVYVTETDVIAYTYNGLDVVDHTDYGVYILNDDDYLYYISDYTKINLSKYNNSKVQSIQETEENIVVTFEDNTTKTIKAEPAYDYNKELKFR